VRLGVGAEHVVVRQEVREPELFDTEPVRTHVRNRSTELRLGEHHTDLHVVVLHLGDRGSGDGGTVGGMGLFETLADLQMQAVNVVHRGLLLVSGGRIGNTVASMPVYEVTTTGRTSGKQRTVMLTAPVVDGDTYVFVASKGGDDRDPDWYRNMVANPAFTAKPVGSGEAIELVARTATVAEKDELWPKIVDAYQGYAGYQTKSERDIPVVIAEPPAG
jgi:deazaflavin-dependent oxidoreductase (nitroreductase family)